MELFKEITDWIRDTFGNKRDTDMLLAHLREEIDELEVAANNYRMHKTADNASDLLCEYADVQILLWNIMSNYGFCKGRLDEGIIIKHNINRKREWTMKDGKMKYK